MSAFRSSVCEPGLISKMQNNQKRKLVFGQHTPFLSKFNFAAKLFTMRTVGMFEQLC